MLKNFFKNHSIHKDLVSKLDPFFILRPTIFFKVWLLVCIGMYIPMFVLGNQPTFISALSLKTISFFFGVSFLAALFSIYYQLNKTKNDYIILEKYGVSYLKNLEVVFILLLTISLTYADYYTLFPCILIGVISLHMFNSSKESYPIAQNDILNIVYVSILYFLTIFSGVIFSIGGNELKIAFLNFEIIMTIFPYVLTFVSIYIYMETYGNNDLKNDNSLNKISKKNISIIALLLILIALIIALILKDPLASTAIATSIFFFIYSFIRSKKKDFLRAIRYTIAIFNFFIITVYPLLFFPLVILFYLSKYYYWHRCNIHYPTFLVDEQTYNPIENSLKKSN